MKSGLESLVYVDDTLLEVPPGLNLLIIIQCEIHGKINVILSKAIA